MHPAVTIDDRGRPIVSPSGSCPCDGRHPTRSATGRRLPRGSGLSTRPKPRRSTSSASREWSRRIVFRSEIPDRPVERRNRIPEPIEPIREADAVPGGGLLLHVVLDLRAEDRATVRHLEPGVAEESGDPRERIAHHVRVTGSRDPTPPQLPHRLDPFATFIEDRLEPGVAVQETFTLLARRRDLIPKRNRPSRLSQ